MKDLRDLKYLTIHDVHGGGGAVRAAVDDVLAEDFLVPGTTPFYEPFERVSELRKTPARLMTKTKPSKRAFR